MSSIRCLRGKREASVAMRKLTLDREALAKAEEVALAVCVAARLASGRSLVVSGGERIFVVVLRENRKGKSGTDLERARRANARPPRPRPLPRPRRTRRLRPRPHRHRTRPRRRRTPRPRAPRAARPPCSSGASRSRDAGDADNSASECAQARRGPGCARGCASASGCGSVYGAGSTRAGREGRRRLREGSPQPASS